MSNKTLFLRSFSVARKGCIKSLVGELGFYSSDWLERPSVKREVTGSTPVRNAPEGGAAQGANIHFWKKWIGRDSSDGRARPLHGRGHGIDARS